MKNVEVESSNQSSSIKGRKIYFAVLLCWLLAAFFFDYQPVLAFVEKTRGAKVLASVLGKQADENDAFICLRSPLSDAQDREMVHDAIRQFQSSNNQPTLSPGTYLLMGASYCLIGDKQTAAEMYDQYEAVKPADPWGQFQLLAIYSDMARMDILQQTLNNASLSKNELALFTQQIRRYHPKIDPFPFIQKTLEISPSNEMLWKAWLRYGGNQEKNEQWNNALQTYQLGIQTQEKDGVRFYRENFYLSIGRLYQTRAQPVDLHKALSYYQQAMKGSSHLDSGDISTVHLYIGETYRGLRSEYQPEQWLNEYLQAYRINPKSYWAALAVGNTYLNDFHDLANAGKYLLIANSLNPSQPYGYLSLGDMYAEGGNISDAITAYQNALRIKPDLKAASDRLKSIQEKH